MELYELMEVCMIIAFGCSWPINVIKSYKVRTAKGKSLAFRGQEAPKQRIMVISNNSDIETFLSVLRFKLIIAQRKVL